MEWVFVQPLNDGIVSIFFFRKVRDFFFMIAANAFRGNLDFFLLIITDFQFSVQSFDDVENAFSLLLQFRISLL